VLVTVSARQGLQRYFLNTLLSLRSTYAKLFSRAQVMPHFPFRSISACFYPVDQDVLQSAAGPCHALSIPKGKRCGSIGACPYRCSTDGSCRRDPRNQDPAKPNSSRQSPDRLASALQLEHAIEPYSESRQTHDQFSTALSLYRPFGSYVAAPQLPPVLGPRFHARTRRQRLCRILATPYALISIRPDTTSPPWLKGAFPSSSILPTATDR